MFILDIQIYADILMIVNSVKQIYSNIPCLKFVSTTSPSTAIFHVKLRKSMVHEVLCDGNEKPL